MSNFNIILISIFIFFTIIGVLIFSDVIKVGDRGGRAGATGTVVLWGTVDQGTFNTVLDDFNRDNRTFTTQYVQKNVDTFDDELTDAFASGIGPDLILLPVRSILSQSDRIFPFPFESFPQRTFRDSFIQEAELFLSPEGVLALPLTIDPLVMYYNRNMLDSVGISQPPTTWDEFYTLAPQLVQIDSSNKIVRSAVALGTFSNITHAKDIIALLLLQLGNPIVTQSEGVFVSLLNSTLDLPVKPAQAALDFFTDFSNPLDPAYSWNQALPSSIDAFIAGDLAFYFGYASELFEIQGKNPNLNFDLVQIPQPRDFLSRTTIGRMSGIAVSKSTTNLTTAFITAGLMAQPQFSLQLSTALALPPARRDLLSQAASGPYMPIFNASALQSRSWLDPSPEVTDQIFSDMVDDIVSGRETVGAAITRASDELDIVLRRL
ncbi:hypothetical protein COB64_02655 [Candidatus Wolfebacteria bacterium]|nr:MAG: hypothetical protein COB64_02655 [Candidatus Wolfebacteria bacterium]